MASSYGVLRASAVLLLAMAMSAAGALVNRTIDDQKGDSITGAMPAFLPETRWNVGQTCTGCLLHPGIIDPGRAFDGTWHDTTHQGSTDLDKMTIQMNFTGSAIYVYNIIANTIPNVVTLTDLSFYIDGDYVGKYRHQPDATSDILYDVLVYQNTSLPHGAHTLEAVASGNDSIHVLFDYAVYAVDSEDDSSPLPPASSQPHPTPSTPPTADSHGQASLNIAAVVGGTVGGVVLCTAVALGLCVYRRGVRQQRRSKRATDAVLGPPKSTDNISSSTIIPYTIAEVAPRLPLASRESGKPGLPRNAQQPEPTMRLSATPTGPTEPGRRSDRLADLTEQIRVLQRQVDELRAIRSGGVNTSGSSGSDATEQSLSSLLTALRSEVSALRAEREQLPWVEDASREGPPSYSHG